MILATHNGDPYGAWSDGVTMWVSDPKRDELRSYSMSTGDYLSTISLAGPNANAKSIWSGGVTMWVDARGRNG